ncbi:hypothetical protein Tco_0064313 [Tanacetum coccineum]
MNELNELRDQAYENSLIYKEKTKKIHDTKIKNRVFNVGDRFLLFNSRLKIFSGKLKTRWTGPFTVAQVFPYGTIELSQTNGPSFQDFEDSIGRGFVHCLLDLQSFECFYMGIRYPSSSMGESFNLILLALALSSRRFATDVAAFKKVEEITEVEIRLLALVS